MDLPNAPRSDGSPSVLPTVAAGGLVGMDIWLWILWVAVHNMGTFLCQHLKLGVHALP